MITAIVISYFIGITALLIALNTRGLLVILAEKMSKFSLAIANALHEAQETEEDVENNKQ